MKVLLVNMTDTGGGAATAFVQGLAQENINDKKLFDVHDEDYQVTIGIVARK